MDTVELRDSWGMTIATLPLSDKVCWQCPAYVSRIKIVSVEVNAGDLSGTFSHVGLPVTLEAGDSVTFLGIPDVAVCATYRSVV